MPFLAKFFELFGKEWVLFVAQHIGADIGCHFRVTCLDHAHEKRAQIGAVVPPVAHRVVEGLFGQGLVHCRDDQVVVHVHCIKSHIGAVAQTRAAQSRHVFAGKKGGVDRVEPLERVKGDKCVVRCVDHIGRIAVAVCKAQAALVGVAGFPACDPWIECCLGPQCQDVASRCGHAIGRSCIAAPMGAVEQHIVKIFKEPVVNLPVEIAVDRKIAEPAFGVADDCKVRPAFVFGIVEPA